MIEIHETKHPRKRLTVDLPSGTLAALKIHAAQRELTIREIVVKLLQKTLKEKDSDIGL